MPYYRCAACDLTVYSGAGYSTARTCPNCGTDLGAAQRVFVTNARRRDLHRQMVREPQAAMAARRDLGELNGELAAGQFDVTALLMTELITNSVQHAGPRAGQMFSLDVSITDAVVRVAVTDGGSGFTPSGDSAREPTDGHWGLQLVDALADRWAIEADRGTRVWFELDRRPADAAQRAA
jgi:anti-sigma regulatory factor (Ser/Thr protein kinase)